MPRAFLVFTHVCLATVLTGTVSAQTVWSGLSLSFAKADGTDPTLAANQDRITGNVWLTRDSTGGIFNIQGETFYSAFSPADTEWATDLNNAGDMIAATNWANLDFAPWIDAYGGMGGVTLPARLTSRNAVVHLVTDDIYLDLRFTAWTQQGGGGFSYMRAVVPEPSGAFLLMAGIATMAVRSARRR